MVCVTVMQAMGAKKKGGGKWSLKDFMPGKPKQNTEEVSKAQARALAR